MEITIKKFFELLKAKQQPYEDALINAMQAKVDWIKKANTWNLNDRQKQALERDKVLVKTTESYISVLQQSIAYLCNELQQANNISADHFQDKLAAEKALRDYIEKDNEQRKIQPAA